MPERIVAYPTDELLLERYQEIENAAVKEILEDNIVGYPLLKEFCRGKTLWSISTHGLSWGSPAGDFLNKAIKSLRETKEEIVFNHPQLLHISFRELVFEDKLPDRTFFNSEQLFKYHQAVLTHFGRDFEPVRLRLVKIMPALDPIDENLKGKRTLSLVAAFVTGGDDTVFRIREGLGKAIEDSGLTSSSIYGGPPKVLFMTLGRLKDAPIQEGGEPPLLNEMQKINNELLGKDIRTDIREIFIISTSRLDYKAPRGHILIWPRIALDRSQQAFGPPCLIRPLQRVK